MDRIFQNDFSHFYTEDWWIPLIEGQQCEYCDKICFGFLLLCYHSFQFLIIHKGKCYRPGAHVANMD